MAVTGLCGRVAVDVKVVILLVVAGIFCRRGLRVCAKSMQPIGSQAIEGSVPYVEQARITCNGNTPSISGFRGSYAGDFSRQRSSCLLGNL